MQDTPSFNDMNSYEKRHLGTIIAFLAREHLARTGKPMHQTHLYKYLAFLNKAVIEKYGTPAVPLTFMAMARGPVPLELYNDRKSLKNSFFSFRPNLDSKNAEAIIVVAESEPDLSILSDIEYTTLRKLIQDYANDFATTDDISESSHEKIKAWQTAYQRKPNSIMDEADELSADSPEYQRLMDNLTFAQALNEHIKG